MNPRQSLEGQWSAGGDPVVGPENTEKYAYPIHVKTGPIRPRFVNIGSVVVGYSA